MHDRMAYRTAQENLLASIDSEASLPGQVFKGPWETYRFFESDVIFTSDFPEIICDLLQIEGSTACCLLNFVESNFSELESSATYFLDEKTTGESYQKFLRGNGPAQGWLYGMDSYGVSSDIGEWCIYCEKANDIAVMGVRNSDKYRSVVERLDAKPIQVLGSTSNRFPFSELTEEWRNGLLRNYPAIE